jgi:hypothetical protein
VPGQAKKKKPDTDPPHTIKKSAVLRRFFLPDWFESSATFVPAGF